MSEYDLFLIRLRWLAARTAKIVKYRFAKVGRLTGRDPKEVAKII